jgi:hypothetical protein
VRPRAELPARQRRFHRSRPHADRTRAAADADLCFAPAGTGGYDDLRREATRERLGKALTVSVASLRDVIRSKEAAGRDKDLAQLPLLRRTLEQTRERDGS